jgi:hypothetical protein
MLNADDYDVFRYFCKENKISMSSATASLINTFLDSTDKNFINTVVAKSKENKLGRPKEK